MRSFIYVQPHIVGNPSNWGYCYDSDRKEFRTKAGARNHGIKEVGSDDFWIAEMKDGRVFSLSNSDMQIRHDNEEVEELNKEWAL